ncbi:hypothetical protein [Streptomyces sp. NPDC013489]|uniref:hypothetical protein n=1 Tax=Streptomyces sp. NPDC013489 TaxID=3155606 RepID=UPI00340CE904
MTIRLVRFARAAAAYLVGLAHIVLALWAGSAAGTYAWQRGITLPLDHSDNAAWHGSLVAGLLVIAAVLTVPEVLVTRLRFAIWGRPFVPCPSCGALGEPIEAESDINPALADVLAHNGEKKTQPKHPKETVK